MIEVSDSSLAYDLQTKVALYARHGAPEVWDWDIPHRQVHVFRTLVNGAYQEHLIARPGDVLEVVALPGVRVEVAAIFGPPEGDAP
jgi:Uma2 family endonuclease